MFFPFQPFTGHPRKPHLFLGIIFIWLASLTVGIAPLLELDGSKFYQTAVMKQNLFFPSWDISFDTLKSFAVKMIQFHPNMRNLTDFDVRNVLNTDSWQDITELLAGRYSQRFRLNNYYGYVVLP